MTITVGSRIAAPPSHSPKASTVGWRLLIVTGAVAALTCIGIVFKLQADAYVLITFPAAVLFQVLIARRPLRELWVRSAPRRRRGPVPVVLAGLLAVTPLVVAVSGWMAGSALAVLYGLVVALGAVPASYALTAGVRRRGEADGRPTVGRLVKVTAVVLALTGPVIAALSGWAVAAAGGPHAADPWTVVPGALWTAATSFALYLPAVFVVEEVLFRGAFDSYVYATSGPLPKTTAVVVTVLWGLWHVPLGYLQMGLAGVAWVAFIHLVLGLPLVFAWRRTGTMAAPGVAHAVLDAVRNGIYAVV